MMRSALGLVAVYNLLPRGITSAQDVKTFQKRLQMELTLRAKAGTPDWNKTYSPRVPLHQHPLLQDGSDLLTHGVLDIFWIQILTVEQFQSVTSHLTPRLRLCM